MKCCYDRRTACQEFRPGDQVLVLTPLVNSPFQAKFTGPYTVAEKLSDLNYMVATPGRRRSVRFCHVNFLKPYYERVVSDISISGVSHPYRDKPPNG